MATHNFKSPVELFKESSAAVQRNLGIFITLSVLSILDAAWQTGNDLRDKAHGSAWSGVVKNSVLGTNSSYPDWGGGLIVSLLGLAAVILSLLMMILVVRAAQQKTVKLEEVWADFVNKWLWLRLIGVIILAGLLIGFSFLLLIIPGIFVLPRLIMAPYVLIDQNLGVMEALNRSWDMTKGHMGHIWMVVLFGIVLALTGVIPVVGPIIAFGLALLYSVAMPLRYFEIKRLK